MCVLFTSEVSFFSPPVSPTGISYIKGFIFPESEPRTRVPNMNLSFPRKDLFLCNPLPEYPLRGTGSDLIAPLPFLPNSV